MASLMLFFSGDLLWPAAVYSVGILFLGFILLNHFWHHFISRILVVFMANNALMMMTILFTHDSYLDIFFLIICGITLLLFDYTERKWFYVLMTYLISLLLIESTPLQNYLPACNLLDTSNIPTMNSVIIIGVIIFIFIQARMHVVVSKVRENDIVSTLSSLKSKNDDVEALGVAVTHDLKTPISIIHFYLNLISRHVGKKYKQDEQLTEFLDTVHVSLNQMEKLIVTYLSFTRMSQMNIETEILNINADLGNVVKNVLGKKIGDDVLIPSRAIEIRSNRILFCTIMQNLIENGLKYNKSEKPQVIIDFEETPMPKIFKIKDNGMGIDFKFANELFKPFKRFNTLVEGTGLGLAIAKRAAEKLNGNLYCKQTGKDGTTFILELSE
jgi:signal transduction histidine kinase